jgi:NAD(P)-dependent dehydrogenase (short-subunit alcohol dehydrogenase family)
MAVTNEGQGGQFLWKELAKRDALVPMGHMGNAFDVAHAVLFLASDEAKYITATELVVDGGLSASVLGRPWEGGP